MQTLTYWCVPRLAAEFPGVRITCVRPQVLQQ